MSNSIKPSELKPFPMTVRKLLAEAINEHSVTYRILDGNHIILFTGDRSQSPIKVSRSRREEEQAKYLLNWLTEYIPSWSTRDRVSEAELSTLAATFNGRPGPSLPAPSSPRPAAPSSPAPSSPPPVADGWRPLGRHGFLTDGTTYRCSQCEFTADKPQGLHLHARWHSNPDEAAEVAAIAGRRASESRKANAEARALQEEQQKTMLHAAVSALADHFGVSTSAPLIEENEHLRKENDRLSRELADANARLALLREALQA